MWKLQGPGIPKIYCLLRRSDMKYNFLVMEQLDQEDLEDKFQKLNRHFSMKTLLMLADQMIENIEIIHEKGVLHNDLKPDNMSMGMDAKNSSQLYIIDFGMCQRWREKNGSHIEYKGFNLFFSFSTNRGSPTYAVFTTSDPTTTIFGLCTRKWGIFV
jgi:serine/threonine protein kinase